MGEGIRRLIRGKRLSENQLSANCIDFLRVLLACAVVFSHCYPLGGFSGEPLWTWTHNGESVGTMAVASFFCLSGFLITRSYLTLRSPLRYLWHRFLRILPGFWVCLVVVAAIFAPVAALREGVPLDHYLSAPQGPWSYLRANAGLQIGQYGFSGLLTHTPTPYAFDGSLWTLIYEFRCYIAIGVLGLIGVLRRASIVVPLIAAMLIVILAVPMVLTTPLGAKAFSTLADSTPLVIEHTACFFVGATIYLYRRWIVLSPLFALAALVGLAVVLPTPLGLALQPVLLGYVLIWCAFTVPIRHFARRGDFSYGIYIYAYPMEQMLALFGLNALGLVPYLGLALLGTIPLAVGSWYLVEGPALRLKHLFARRDRPNVGEQPAAVTSVARPAAIEPVRR